ncbi:MAG: hypothetical protein EOP83_24565 [Verrucomicrobiaceae bacterium]|nr:MAG: hypothetical protein EOP83_24565 [Verrucomicrobiaceae bacterium]
MKTHEYFILITAAFTSFFACRAVAADRFKNPVTDICVIVGGILPWLLVAMWLGWPRYSGFLLFLSVFVSLPLFSGALLRYWLGARFDNWERAAVAMVAAIMAQVGYWVSIKPWLWGL